MKDKVDILEGEDNIMGIACFEAAVRDSAARQTELHYSFINRKAVITIKDFIKNTSSDRCFDLQHLLDNIEVRLYY